ncbi:histidine phosphatase family protein [Peribacillus sp. SCS-155]|uniref:histidine phosphatase family protein n=1 Tax=Peribacillus sedimenti TaxID=3115297 RepID=UPI00390674F0
MDDTVVISLFRHGMTDANRKKVYLGWTDSPLVEAYDPWNPGEKSFKGLVFSSDLRRCTETASMLFPRQMVSCLQEIREMNFGSWEGLTYKDLKNQAEYIKWLEDPFTCCPPKGETFSEFSERVERGWSRISEALHMAGQKNAAIVTHGGVVRYFLWRYANEQKPFWEWAVPHGGGWQMTFILEDYRRGCRCTSLQEVPIMARQDG